MKLVTIRKYTMSLEYLHIFVPEPIREEALELHSQFVGKLWWGGKVVGVKVSLAGAKPTVVKQLVRLAWTHMSPTALQSEYPKMQ
jgi:hypothetical protein